MDTFLGDWPHFVAVGYSVVHSRESIQKFPLLSENSRRLANPPQIPGQARGTSLGHLEGFHYVFAGSDVALLPGMLAWTNLLMPCVNKSRVLDGERSWASRGPNLCARHEPDLYPPFTKRTDGF